MKHVPPQAAGGVTMAIDMVTTPGVELFMLHQWPGFTHHTFELLDKNEHIQLWLLIKDNKINVHSEIKPQSFQ